MRVTSAVPSRKRRKRAIQRAKGFYGASSKRIRTVYDAIDKADAHAYVGRKQKKRQFRSLWTVRINAACRMLDFEGLIDRALANTELVKVRYHD